ncbi:MAG: MoxR family ATPase, partial [Desulfuromonadales bacterium]
MPTDPRVPILHVIETLAERYLKGKVKTVKLAMLTLLSEGHLLLEDIPGLGKTTLALALAHALGLSFGRIQCTSDLLPSDITGLSIYNRDTNQFNFIEGPIFNNLVLADEINRAMPKTQSALLEAMEEHRVTVEGKTYRLPEPFFVIATQNPRHQIGTFPLPESQLDRFMMRIDMGYPDRRAERALLTGRDRREIVAGLEPAMDAARLADLQNRVPTVHKSDALLDYVQDLLDASRRSTHFANGLSPRAGLALLHAAQAWALLAGRDAVIPEDIQAVLPSVVGHRLQP